VNPGWTRRKFKQKFKHIQVFPRHSIAIRLSLIPNLCRESVKEVAKRFQVTPYHVDKYRRNLSKTATGLEDEVDTMNMNEAEVLTALPAEDQSLVVGALREVDALEGNVAAITRNKKIWAMVPDEMEPELERFAEVYI
jgi:transposase-like protein